MVAVEIHETIDRPIEEVFERLVDIAAYQEWIPKKALLVASTQDSPGPAGLGTTYSDKTWLGTARGEIVAFEQPNRVVFRYAIRWFGVLVMRGWPGYVLEPEGPSRTNVHHTAKGQLHGAFKLLLPIAQLIARSERQRTVHALKESLESSTAR